MGFRCADRSSPDKGVYRRDAKLSLQTLTHPLVAYANAACVQIPHDARPTVAALGRRVNRCDLRIQRRIGDRALARRTHPPLTKSRAETPKTRHSGSPRKGRCAFRSRRTSPRPFAKYAAAFFTISRSSFVLASSRRNRAFSASSSLTGRFADTAAPLSALSLPARFSRTQLCRLDSGIPNRLAAWLPPIDSANRTASTLNSSE